MLKSGMTKLKMSEKENVVELYGQGNKNEIGEGLAKAIL